LPILNFAFALSRQGDIGQILDSASQPVALPCIFVRNTSLQCLFLYRYHEPTSSGSTLAIPADKRQTRFRPIDNGAIPSRHSVPHHANPAKVFLPHFQATGLVCRANRVVAGGSLDDRPVYREVRGLHIASSPE
jgi:hypothetical protein